MTAQAVLTQFAGQIDLVTPPFRGIEASASIAEIRAALAEFRERHGQLPWHMLNTTGRA